MKEKSYAVIGLGQFGKSLAETLADSNCDVLAVDRVEERVQEIQEKVAYAVRADVREPGVLRSLGIQNVDVAVIAISENMEASVMATMQAKDLGVPTVIAKAGNGFHGRILSKLGADQVIYPEQSMGLRVARNLMSNGFLDVFELSSEFSIAEIGIPKAWIGKSLVELKLRERYGINIIGIKNGETVQVDLRPEEPFTGEGTLIAIGKNRDLEAEFGNVR